MHILSDKAKKPVGYLYHNVILLPGHKVAGVILAHCIFTKNGEVKGKFFRGNLHNEMGQIIAQDSTGSGDEITAEQGKHIMIDAWKILSRTSNHICPWVVASDEWSEVELEEFLSQ
jgi:hypothetical protein